MEQTKAIVFMTFISVFTLTKESTTPHVFNSISSTQKPADITDDVTDDDTDDVIMSNNDNENETILNGNNTRQNTSLKGNTNSEESEPIITKETKDTILEVVNCGFIPAVCLFGVIGNIMSLVVLFVQGLQERSNIILIALASSDTLLLLVTILRRVSCIVTKLDKNAGFDIMMIMQNEGLMLHVLFGRLTSVLTMLISIERFIAVYFPLKAHFLLTRTRVKVAVGVILALVVGAMVPVFMLYRTEYIYSRSQKRVIPYPRTTAFYNDNQDILDVYLTSALNVLFRYLPMLVVCVFTVMVIGRVKRSTSWRKKTSSSADTKNVDRVTNMLVTVSSIYILCLMPGAVILTLRFHRRLNLFGAYSNLFNLLGGLTVLLKAVNSSANFIVYMAMSKKFVNTYKRVFLCRRQQQRHDMTVTTSMTNVTSVSTVVDTAIKK